MRKKLVVIAGPTAVGKTACAIQIASHFNTEIINADSRQIYKGLDIGTAKPTFEQLQEIKHHFVDLLDITEEFTAGKFEKEVDLVLSNLFKVKDIVVMSGGTGFYIDAAINGLDKIPKSDLKIRQQLITEYESSGLQNLLSELKEKDRQTFAVIDQANPHRVMRAIEVIRLTGRPYSSFKKNVAKPNNFDVVKIALDLPRKELYDRINLRVDKMMEMGLVEEVKKHIKYENAQALQTVGYKEIISYLHGVYTMEEAVDLIKRNSRRYAKRQLTWLRRDEAYHWKNPEDIDGIIDQINEIEI